MTSDFCPLLNNRKKKEKKDMRKLVAALSSVGLLCVVGPISLNASVFTRIAESESHASHNIHGLVVKSASSPKFEVDSETYYGVWIEPSLHLLGGNSELVNTLKKHLGSPLTEDVLQTLRMEITNLYQNHQRNSGSFNLDLQEVTEGVVHILVIDTDNRALIRADEALSSAQIIQTALNHTASSATGEVCQDDPLSLQVKTSRLSTKEKVALLAEKTDQLAEMIDELNCRDVHINSGLQAHLECDQNCLFVTADFLYWQADEDALEYVMHAEGFGQPISDAVEELPGLNFEWNPGFRVGVGGTVSSCDHWGLFLNYTHIRNKAHGSKDIGTISDGNILASTWDQVLLGFFASAAKAHWSVNYNTEKLEVFRDFFVRRNLIFKPHMGLLNANINQEYHATYTLVPEVMSSLPESTLHAKCNYWGLGVEGGADLFWHFSDHFGMYGELSAGLVYGKFNINRHGNSAIPTDAGVARLFTYHFKKEIWRTRATVQAALGVEWETLFNRDRNRIAISLGYEFNEWFRQNQFFQSVLQPTRDVVLVTGQLVNGDLAFKGGTLRATFNF